MASAVLAASAILKLIDFAAFVEVLRAWQSLPKWSVPIIAGTLPFAELVLGGLWLANVGRRWVSWASVALVGGATVMFFIERSMHSSASCGCFGRLTVRLHSLEQPAVKAAMSGAMILAWTIYALLVAVRKNPTGHASTASTINSPKPAEAKGLTLVEVLVTLTVIGLLIGLLALTLGRARATARASSSLASLRSHVQVFESYATDARGYYPYFTTPTYDVTFLNVNGLGRPVDIHYFEAGRTWHMLLAGRYYTQNYTSDTYFPPISPQRLDAAARVFAGYWYSCTFLAGPDYWDFDRHRRPTSQWRAVPQSAVRTPGEKALLTSSWVIGKDGQGVPASGLTDAEFGFVDGSAAAVRNAELGIDFGGHGDRTTGDPGDKAPGMHTMNGTAGRDRRTRN